MKRTKISSLCLILLVSVVLLFGLVGCGAQASTNDMSDRDIKYSPNSPTVSESFSSSAGFVEMEVSKDMVADMPMAPSVKPSEDILYTSSNEINVDMTEKIIYSANLNIESTEFDSSLQMVEKLLNDFGGFISNSNITGSSSYDKDGNLLLINRYAYYTLRIPALRFEEFLNSAGSLGNITSKSQNADNITAEFYDNEARKASLETQEQRLLELLAQAKDINDIITLESKLSDVRYQIESIESRLRNWQSKVDYSIIDITIREVSKYTPSTPIQLTFGERIARALGGSLENFVDGFQDFIIDLIYSLPALIIWIGIITLAVILIRKGMGKRKITRKTKLKAESSFTAAAEDEENNKPE